MNSDRLNKIKQEKIQVVIVFIFIILFLILLFASLLNQSERNVPIVQDNSTQEASENILPVDDSKKIIVNNFEINLEEKYTVNTIYKNSQRFVCAVRSPDCIVYEVISGEDYFYLSSSEFTVKDSLATEEAELVLDLENLEFIAKSKMMMVSTREFDSPEARVLEDFSLPRQVYGCVENKFCFNGGIFSESISENGIQLSNLISFINSIKQ